MREYEYKEFATLLATEAQFYPSPGALTQGKADGYFESLGRFELNDVKAAFKRLRERSEFFPTIRAIVEQAEGAPGEKAEVAWNTFFGLLSEGTEASVQFYDRAMAYAVESLGGYIAISDDLRESTIEMVANYERRFKAAYKLASDRDLAPRKQYYAGWIESSNRLNHMGLRAWADRTKEKYFNIPVCVVTTNEYRKLKLPFEVDTMQIEGAARRALEAGGSLLLGYMPEQRKPQLQIVAPASEPDSSPEISEFEKRRLLKQIQSMGKSMRDEAVGT